MIKDLPTQMDKIVINTKARMLAVVQQSIKKTINEAQTLRPAGKMRFKTGFLWGSGVASLNTPPTGPSRGDPKGTYKWDEDSIMLVLTRMKLGDVFYFGWTARYAKYREVFDGFLESALQNWQKHVDEEVQYYRNKDVRK